jgi:hypothetical protein
LALNFFVQLKLRRLQIYSLAHLIESVKLRFPDFIPQQPNLLGCLRLRVHHGALDFLQVHLIVHHLQHTPPIRLILLKLPRQCFKEFILYILRTECDVLTQGIADFFNKVSGVLHVFPALTRQFQNLFFCLCQFVLQPIRVKSEFALVLIDCSVKALRLARPLRIQLCVGTGKLCLVL